MNPLEAAMAEMLGNSFTPYPGWEPQACGGDSTPLAKYSAELRARAKGHMLRRIKYEPPKKSPFPAPVKPVEAVPIMRLAKIAYFVSQATGVPVVLIRSARRQTEITRARYMFFWLARECTPLSFPAIGLWCGRDHSTVMHGAKKVSENIADYPELEKIKALLEAGE